MNEALARRVFQLIGPDAGHVPQGVTPTACADLVREVLGPDELRIYEDARLLVWDIARHDGYDIPAYPLAGCGDAREFLRDEGVRNVPQWYELHLGMKRAEYDEIWKIELVMVRNREMCRRVWTVPAGMLRDGGAEPRFILDLHLDWLGFALGHATPEQDDRLFKR